MFTELHSAAYTGDVERAKELLKQHPDWVAGSDSDGTPLHRAAEQGHTAIVELLLRAGAEVNAKNEYGRTPLHEAASHNHTRVAELLLAKAADINATCKYDVTPLHWAARMGHEEMSELLLANGAQADAADDGGQTPLQVAEEGIARMDSRPSPFPLSGPHRKVAALIRKHIELQRRGHGQTPESRAGGRTESATAPKADPSGARGPETNASAQGVVSHPKRTDPLGVEKLIAAAKRGDAIEVHSLLHNGVDPNAKNEKGWTALMSACSANPLKPGHHEVVRMLLERGADANARSSHGQTALKLVGRRSGEIGALLNASAKTTDPTKAIGELNPAALHESPQASANSSGSMASIEGGTFEMGDTFGLGEAFERPVHSVTLRGFFLDKCPVAFHQYDEFCHATQRAKPIDEGWGRADRPAINVSWFDAVAFANWRSSLEGLSPCYVIRDRDVEWELAANGYRLPTEAEWEYAARGGNKSQGFVYSGGNRAGEIGWHDDNSGDMTHPVGGKTANELGLYDLSGNVWEWCWDWADPEYYSGSSKDNPTGPSDGVGRVCRGGSVFNFESELRTSNRSYLDPSDSSRSTGFRLARSRS